MKRLFFILVFILNIVSAQINVPLTLVEKENTIDKCLAFESDSINSFLIYRNYVVKFNYKERTPDYTIHFLNTSYIENFPNVKRASTFYIDEVNLNSKSATNGDYRKSGYDRGHMVPAGDFNCSQNLKNETFYLSNIFPQNPGLNRGIWAELEKAIREKIVEWNTYGIVVTGVIYDSISVKTIGIDKVGVPDYCYKLVFFPDSNKMLAFLFDNRVKYYESEITDYQVTVDNIEMITHLDFFENLPDDIEEKLEAEKVKFRY